MIGKDLRIVYMGTPEFAVAPLKALVESGYNVVAVVTMPDKPAGRGQKIHQSAVKEYALEAGLPLLQPEKLKEESFVESFKALNVDLGIVVAFRMLPEVIWDAPKFGTFNLHASLLPDYRGAAPINWAIMNGDKFTGVTTFLLNHKIDEGAVIEQSRVEIEPQDNIGTLHDKLMVEGVDLILKTVDKIAEGGYEPIPQTEMLESAMRPAPKIFKDTCHVDFAAKGEDIVNLVRGLSPYPAAWAQLDEKLSVKLFEVAFESADHGKCVGEVVTDDKNFVKVTCSDGYISILDLQISGKKRMKVADMLRGFRGFAEFVLH